MAAEGDGDRPKPWKDTGEAVANEGPGTAGSVETGPGCKPGFVDEPGMEGPGTAEPG